MGKKIKIPKNLDIEDYIEKETRRQKAREEKVKMDMKKQQEIGMINKENEEQRNENIKRFKEELKINGNEQKNAKKIKCLRLSHYNFPQKINEKLLTD